MSGKLGFQYRVSLSELDADKFIKAIKDACRKSLVQAAKSFLLAAVPRVPVYTGFASGAFGNLEAELRFKQSRPTPRAPRRFYYYPNKGTRIVRTPTNGRQFGTPRPEIFSAGKARIAEGAKVFFFRYSIDIKYFNYLDRAKWHSFEEGYKAFNETARSELDRLKPKIGKYLVKRELKK